MYPAKYITIGIQKIADGKTFAKDSLNNIAIATATIEIITNGIKNIMAPP